MNQVISCLRANTTKRVINDIKYDTAMLDLLRPGNSVRVRYGSLTDNPQMFKYHILAIVDDDHVVYKHWNKRKQRWTYQVDSLYYFRLLWEEKDLVA